MRAGKPESKVITKALSIWSIITDREVAQEITRTDEEDSSAGSTMFQPCSEFFHFIACVLLFAQSIVIPHGAMERNNDDHHQYYQKYVKSDTMMILSIGIGVFYFIYIICWIKVQFHLVENEDFSPKSTLRNRNRTKKNSTASDQSKASTPFGHQEAMLDEESKRGQNSPLAVPEGGGDDVVEAADNESSQ